MDKLIVKKIQKIIDDSLVMKTSREMARGDILDGFEFEVCVLESEKAAKKIIKLIKQEGVAC